MCRENIGARLHLAPRRPHTLVVPTYDASPTTVLLTRSEQLVGPHETGTECEQHRLDPIA